LVGQSDIPSYDTKSGAGAGRCWYCISCISQGVREGKKAPQKAAQSLFTPIFTDPPKREAA